MSSVFFVEINDRIMVKVEAETKEQVKKEIRAKLETVPDDCVKLRILRSNSPEMGEALERSEVISQAELGLLHDSYVSAKNGIAEALRVLREARFNLEEARTNMREAQERAKEMKDWFKKQAWELGIEVNYKDEEDDEDMDEDDLEED